MRTKDIGPIVRKPNAIIVGIGFAVVVIQLSNPHVFPQMDSEGVYWFTSTFIQGLFAGLSVTAVFTVLIFDSIRSIKSESVREIRNIDRIQFGHNPIGAELMELVDDWLEEENEGHPNYETIRDARNKYRNAEKNKRNVWAIIYGITYYIGFVILLNTVVLFFQSFNIVTSYPWILTVVATFSLTSVIALSVAIVRLGSIHRRITEYKEFKDAIEELVDWVGKHHHNSSHAI